MSYGTPVFQKNNLSHLKMFGVVRYGNTSCDSACRTLEIQLLSDRRREQCGSLFRQIVLDESHVLLHYLLPTKRDSHITDRLPSAKTYPSFHVRTSRFQNSFIPYALTNLQ